MEMDFSSEAMKKFQEESQLRYEAGRDAEIRVFRLVWEQLDASQRAGLREALWTLHTVQGAISELSRRYLSAPNLATDNRFAGEAVQMGEDRSPAAIAIVKLKEDIFITPAELICAMDCWSNGETYIPEGALHPRWPDEEERKRAIKFQIAWDSVTAAGPDEVAGNSEV